MPPQSDRFNKRTADVRHMLKKLEVCHPLYDVFNDCRQRLQQRTNEFEQNYDHLKQNIRELCVVVAAETERLEALRTTLQSPAVTNIQQQIDELLKKKEVAECSLSKAESDVPAQRKLLDAITLQCKQLSSTCPGILKKTKAKMDLYSGITRITWKYNAPDSEISGYVCRPDKKDVIPFSLDTSKQSQFFITNFLWNQLALNTQDFE